MKGVRNTGWNFSSNGGDVLENRAQELAVVTASPSWKIMSVCFTRIWLPEL